MIRERTTKAQRNIKIFLLFVPLWFFLPEVYSQQSDLTRKAYTGLSLREPAAERAGAVVRRVAPDSPAARAGVQEGDTILKINGQILSDPIRLSILWDSLRSDKPVKLTILRADTISEVALNPEPFPKDVIEGCDVIYSSLITDRGHRLRTIITKPKGVQGRLPAILFVQWLSCDSIELPSGDNSGWSRVMRGLASRSGFVMMRVEKPGLGDSEGPPCAECDYLTELSGHRAALKELKKLPFVDPDSIYIFGGSMGGAIAPLLAQDEKIKGIVVAGTFAKTWFEHMIEIERRRLELSGRTPLEISRAMNKFSEFYTLFLINKKTPEEIIKSRPHLAEIWYEQPRHQYGRPASFYQQAQDMNIEAAWDKISARVLILHGEYDWIMSRDDNELISRIVNRNHSGRARFVEYPGMDHHFLIYESPKAAFDGNPQGRFDEKVLNLLLDWLNTVQTGKQ